MTHAVRMFFLGMAVTVAGISANDVSAARRKKYKPVPPAKSGVIEGEVVFEGRIPPRRKLKVPKGNPVCSAHPILDERLVVSKDRKVRYAVASIDLTEGKPFPADAKYALDQKGCVYRPHVMVVPVRREMSIYNSDGILHNVHIRPLKNREFNRAMPGPVKEMKVKFRRPERIPVKCDAHDWMSAWIVVAADPYTAVSGEDGGFRMTEVPEGTHTVTLWHEVLGTRKQQVTVRNGQVAKVRFVLRKK